MTITGSLLSGEAGVEWLHGGQQPLLLHEGDQHNRLPVLLLPIQVLPQTTGHQLIFKLDKLAEQHLSALTEIKFYKAENLTPENLPTL